ncbi:hypothetical protein ACRAQ7_06695 [Erythrobacter sp. W53]|uniref:hypothetical protein n=1 Tax=Erythrobacter sp. W53 TaxID=3425947 RepID=UPI003D7673EA
MRRSVIAAALPFALLAAPVAAQEIAPPDQADGLTELSQTLSDPVKQQQIANTLAVLSEVILDLPLAPIVEPLSRAAGDITGEEAEPVDPDMTLRRMRPEASDLPAEITDKVPRAMSSMAAMSDGLAALLPALRTMAEQLKTALPSDRGNDY